MAIKVRQHMGANACPLMRSPPETWVRSSDEQLAQNDNRSLGPATVRSRRRWTINGDFVNLQPAGVARYAKEVTQSLDTLFAEGHPLTEGVELDLVAPREPGEALCLRAIPLRVVAEFSYPRLPQVWVQLQLPRHVDGGLLSFCNLAPVINRKHIVCIHDMHTRLMPDSYGRLFRWAHRAILPVVGRRSGLITTVSSLSRDHLIRFGIAPAEKIVVTCNGCEHAANWRPEMSQLQLRSDRPFIVFLGRKQKYKNLNLVLQIAQQLDQIGVDIYMAGDIDDATIATCIAEERSNIHMLGRISDDDFARVLSWAICLILPSRIEGFGLPAIEAMKLGCPVIASSAPALPEVCGDAALLVDPDDGAGWVSAISCVKDNVHLRRCLIDKGYSRARAYSWRDIGKLYLKLMARVDGVDPEAPGRPPDCQRSGPEQEQTRTGPGSQVPKPRRMIEPGRR